MAVRTLSAMEGNTSPISSTAVASLESPQMSRNTTPSAPASEFGNLALGSSSSGSSGRSMAPVTRSASRRGGPGSQAPSTRPTAGTSRRPQAQAGAGSSRRQASQRSAPVDDDEDDDSTDDDSSEEENEDDRNRARAELRRQRLVNVYDLFSLSDPDYLTGQEIMTAATRSANAATHRAITTAVVRQADSNPAFYQSLMGVVQVPGAEWARQLHGRLEKRMIDIFRQLDLNVQEPPRGQDVINTATRLWAFVSAIDNVTKGRYWDSMQPETRRHFAELLLRTLGHVVQRDEDPYQRAGVARPQYAGQTAEDTNLYRRLCVNPRGPVFIVDVLIRMDPDGRLLASSAGSLAILDQSIQAKHSVQGADGQRTARASPQPPQDFVANLRLLWRRAYNIANAAAR